MGSLGMRELIVILLAALLMFGAKRPRSVGSDLGSAVRGFKNAVNEGNQEPNDSAKEIRSEERCDAAA
jgi:sec-independent protein translocase protein TatA